MRLFLKCAVVAASAVFALPRSAVAQNDVGYVCAFAYNTYDKIAWVGRTIVRVHSPEHFRTPGDMADLVSADFRTRTRGTYSREDLEVTDRLNVDGYFGQFTSGHSSVDEAQRECLKQIENHRREGYQVYGVGDPIFAGRDFLRVQHLNFLSILEFSNYVPGTVAARARQREIADGRATTGGSTTGGTASTGPRWVDGRCIGTWWECETPAQREARIRQQREANIATARRLYAQADALYEQRDFRGAREIYVRVANFPAYQEIAEERQNARERYEHIDRTGGVLEYANFTAATGISFGVAMGQSALKADNTGLITALVKMPTFGLPLVYSWGTGLMVLGSALSGDGTAGVAGEFTRYTLGVNTIIPQLRAGNFGVHVGYQFQKTDRRGMHLVTSGISYGGNGGPLMRLDITPVYGKLFYGAAIVLDFGDLFN